MKLLAYKTFKENNLKQEDSHDLVGNLFASWVKDDTFAMCHLIGRDFFTQLIKVKLNILPEYLTGIKKCLYIEYPYDIYINNDIFFSGCILAPLLDPDGVVKRLGLGIFMNNGAELNSLTFYIDVINLPIHTIEEYIDSISEISKSKYESAFNDVSKEDWSNIFRISINSILYVMSGNPDLRMIRPPLKSKYKTTKGMKKFIKEYPLDIPMVYVGYNYKKHNFYSVDGTTVKGHFRWQPYGNKRSLIKLIWIDTYEKIFNKEINDT